ncbi:unnamed protein product [Kuraishia capsulata CBS 1993]|uniref:Elongation factor methyltransferase 7 n=1 Tax=Kuraishia capsulata CBS 1993 TaxID=1382522 RepID=W6MQU4_9ASCO|nr:uncharacterized protein KUCA_T00005027001 [Kuraishia capsulata CBS 1993]CDK29041.1 unnamed protein product [Kuraishia capsulata CBS 1993]
MSDDFELSADLFEEPEDFRPPPAEAHMLSYSCNSTNREISLRLVGKSPLWGHLLWNAGKYTAQFLESHASEICGKTVVELGAASALPSLICHLVCGASKVVATDYPDAELLENIDFNLKENKCDMSTIVTRGLIWGNDVEEVVAETDDGKFDWVILSDLVFNHTEHTKLLKNCKDLVKPKTGKCLVVFSPHRAHLIHKDFEFFENAKENFGFDVEEIEMQHWGPMFPEDPKETEEIRSRVYSYYLKPTW